MFRIGVDVGGTFTDYTVLDESAGQVYYYKVPSTPDDPSRAIRDGIAQLLEKYNIEAEAVSHLGHGTTVATNMVIERQGSPIGLLTTKGFRDVLEIGRQARPNLYDYSIGKPIPLVPRQHRLEIPERLDVEGNIVTPIDEQKLIEAITALKKADVDAVAVCFLHSYRLPDHEKLAREHIESIMPNAYISLSCEVLPEIREYERLSTTVLNAYIGPRMQGYLEQFLNRVKELGIKIAPLTIQSNGGLMSVNTVRKYPVRTCLSGPAAGVVGAAEVARVAGFENLVTFDVGGTSTDVSLVSGSRPLFASDRSIADYPIKTPMIDIHVIGAGGGSIAHMDDAGALKVGPKSAGAHPGPAAYGKGGERPTITDAHICLHRLNPVALLEGRMPVDKKAAQDVIEKNVANPLGLKTEEAAHGIVRIVNANMSRAIRSVSTERGYDIKEFALFAYGGAGPLHAAELAVECGIPKIIVPQEPGTMCARGMLLSDISLDFVRSEISEANENSWKRVCELFDVMVTEGHEWLEDENVEENKRSFVRYIEARYQGQNYEVKVEMEAIHSNGLKEFLILFHKMHEKEYGYDIPDRAVEIVNCRLQAIGSVPKVQQRPQEKKGSLEDAEIGKRKVYFGSAFGWVDTSIYSRSALPIEENFLGPAIIEEMSSTTVVLPEQSVEVDSFGNIIIEIKA